MTDERAIYNLLHETLDRMDVSGPFQRLQIELEKPGASRRHRARRILMTRNRMVLLAAALIALVVASVLVGTRVYRDYQNNSQVPVSHPHIDQAAVDQLLTRPLKFQKLLPAQTCPADGPFTNGWLGAGPVYGQGANVDVTTSWGAYDTSMVITPPGLPGPIIVRGENLRTGGPLVTYGLYTAGPLYGTDVINGKQTNQYTVTALDADHSPKASFPFGGGTYVAWSIEQGWPHHSVPFCAGLQIDGPGLTEVFYATVGAGPLT